MKVISERPVLVFRKDGQYGAMYSIGLSNKKQDGTYDNDYITIRFLKDVDVKDQTMIDIKDAFLTFYRNKEGQTIKYIKVMSFNVVGTPNGTKKDIQEDNTIKNNPYEEMGKEIALSDDDLPF